MTKPATLSPESSKEARELANTIAYALDRTKRAEEQHADMEMAIQQALDHARDAGRNEAQLLFTKEAYAQGWEAAIDEASEVCHKWAKAVRGGNPDHLDQALAVENRQREIDAIKTKARGP